MFKGFGFTLRNDNDFKVCNSNCASSATFQPLYGAMDDGNVCCPENIKHFSEKVLHETENKGVHFMMSDGVQFFISVNKNSVTISRTFRVFPWKVMKIFKRFFRSNYTLASV